MKTAAKTALLRVLEGVHTFLDKIDDAEKHVHVHFPHPHGLKKFVMVCKRIPKEYAR